MSTSLKNQVSKSVHLFPGYCRAASSHQEGKLPFTLVFTAFLIEFIPKASIAHKAIYHMLPEVHREIGMEPKSHCSTQNCLAGCCHGLCHCFLKLLRRNGVILGRKFHFIVVKSHLHTPWIVFKFPICNTLLWRMTELRGINVTAPSGYLCDPGMKSKELAEAETHTQIWGEKIWPGK